jgi:prevent-host-death family protein
MTILMTMSKVRRTTTHAEIGAGEFKAKCLELMDSVARTGSTVTITKRGVPVARLVPVSAPPGALFGCLKGTFEEVGDIVGRVGSEAPSWGPDEGEVARLLAPEPPKAAPKRRRSR